MGSLFEALRAPMLASPDSLTGQLDFIRENWTKYLGEDLRRVLLAIDVLREEDIAIWMRFHPPGPDRHRHGAPGWGSEGFVGDEFVGFDEDFVVGPDGVRHRRYAADYQAPLHEYEAFSADQAWMPNVVLIAKSTYVWLEQLSKKYGRHIHRLDQIPDEELRLLADSGITGLWLIGLWERSIASRTIKRLRGHGDAVASAYSLKEYQIADDLGGEPAISNLRDRAAAFGIRLASDMVPNHMGIDSPWVIDHPDWFISRPESPFPVYSFTGPDLSPDSRVEIKIEDHYYDQTDAAVVFRLRHHRDGTNTLCLSRQRRHHIRMERHGPARLFQSVKFASMSFRRSCTSPGSFRSSASMRRWCWPSVMCSGFGSRCQAPEARFHRAPKMQCRRKQFDALMPHEFWREVVDRVAAEVPGTLLLAEAFWLLEGYFVRTLGMHRVYNSAFMNMLRDEENAKYRSYLKKTIEFDPDILKRYVNFMSNPDERTAIDQFGTGDKYFGVCTLLATLPGLPMFGHGQIEGFTERYGMEFKRARMDEHPNEGLIARHQHDIAPLLKNRRLFAESTNFVLYDFWTDHGTVDENVFAYSNRLHDERALILYNNRYGSTRGTIHNSAASMDKGKRHVATKEPGRWPCAALRRPSFLRFATLPAALSISAAPRICGIMVCIVDLRGYQCLVLLNWRELRASAYQPWDALCDALNGEGVHSVDEALSKLRLRPLHEALRQAISASNVHLFAEIAGEPMRREFGDKGEKPATVTTADEATGLSEQHSHKKPHDQASEISEPSATLVTIDPRLCAFIEKSQLLFDRAVESLPADGQELMETLAVSDIHPIPLGASVSALPGPPAAADGRLSYRETCEAMTVAALRLPRLERTFSTVWPSAVRYMLPSDEPGVPLEWTWAPVLAWVVLRSFPMRGSRVALFDKLQLRSALAEIFSSMGMEDEKTWRAAARVRVLLLQADSPSASIDSEEFWADPDARWLAGVNQASGKTYVNKEQFEELLSWLQLPALLEISQSDSGESRSIGELEATVSRACQRAEDVGYNLEEYLGAVKRDRVGMS